MSPFMRGFYRGWNTVFGGADQYFGDMIGFMVAVIAGLVGVAFVICGIAWVFGFLFKKIPDSLQQGKKWWDQR